MNRNIIFWPLCLLVMAGFALAPYLVFIHAPTSDQLGGFIQKIFYFHVPCAWAMFLAAVLAAVGGGASLSGRRWGNWLCDAGAELAVLFGVVVMTTGPLWGKKAWGHYWVWDVRLITMLVLFLTFVAVLLARRYAGPARHRVAAGLSIFGAVNLPLVYISVNLWRGQHPKTSYVGSLSDSPAMLHAFFVCLALFTLLFVLLLWLRLNLAQEQDRLDELAIALQERT